MRQLTTLTLLLICTVSLLFAQQKPITKANYELPARFTPAKMQTMVFSTNVDPHYLKKSQRFWYQYSTSNGRNWYIVDPIRGTKELLFDPVHVATQVTKIVRDPYDALHLPIYSIRFNDDETGFIFAISSSVDMTKDELEEFKQQQTVLEFEPDKKIDPTKKIHFLFYDLTSGQVSELKDYQRPKPNPSWANVSPDRQTVLFSRGYDLYWMNAEDLEKAKISEKDSTIVEHRITEDGEEFFAWGGRGYSAYNNKVKEDQTKRSSTSAIWSPDSKHFALSRTDLREVGDLWVIHHTESPRPTLESYKYHMPGEPNAPQSHLYLFDNSTKEYRELDVSAYKDQDFSVDMKPFQKRNRDDLIRPAYEWLGTNDCFYLTRTSRDMKRIDICQIDVATGELKVLVEERLNTSMETRQIWPINEGKEFIHWSQRSGWANLYLYSGDGTLKHKITDGDFHCETVIGVDQAKRLIYFIANGVEKSLNPYFTHLYSVGFDGRGMKRLNQLDFDHSISQNDDNQYFIDNHSRVNTTPVSTLYSTTGRKIMELEKADLSLLFASGYKFPEPFMFKAADGVTDMWGVMYKPFDFDSTRLYPIIEYVYPGPQTEAVETQFYPRIDRTDRLAQFGFVVITLGNRGGHPNRSKWYHNYGYGNLRDYGLADKKTAVEQLANRHAWIDRTKVGIHGHSGGGFMSTAAILKYPDFFKVAVSSAGNHQNNIYNSWWSEKHHGVLEKVSEENDTTFVYNIARNADIASNLKGRLMLFTGDVDENVHSANTYTLVRALIQNNKRFDMMVLPGQRHGFGDMNEYFFWRMGDYFSRYLIEDSENSVDIPQMSP